MDFVDVLNREGHCNAMKISEDNYWYHHVMRYDKLLELDPDLEGYIKRSGIQPVNNQYVTVFSFHQELIDAEKSTLQEVVSVQANTLMLYGTKIHDWLPQEKTSISYSSPVLSFLMLQGDLVDWPEYWALPVIKSYKTGHLEPVQSTSELSYSWLPAYQKQLGLFIDQTPSTTKNRIYNPVGKWRPYRAITGNATEIFLPLARPTYVTTDSGIPLLGQKTFGFLVGVMEHTIIDNGELVFSTSWLGDSIGIVTSLPAGMAFIMVQTVGLFLFFCFLSAQVESSEVVGITAFSLFERTSLTTIILLQLAYDIISKAHAVTLLPWAAVLADDDVRQILQPINMMFTCELLLTGLLLVPWCLKPIQGPALISANPKEKPQILYCISILVALGIPLLRYSSSFMNLLGGDIDTSMEDVKSVAETTAARLSPWIFLSVWIGCISAVLFVRSKQFVRPDESTRKLTNFEKYCLNRTVETFFFHFQRNSNQML